jgi:Tol biopolymer transport system component
LTSGPTRWGSPIPSKDGKTIFARGVTLRGELSRYDSQSKQLLPFLGGISAEFVAFSSDRKWVAYVSYPEGILWKADRDGSNPVRLSDPPLYPKSISWSPDNSQIAFWDKPIGASNAESYVVSSQGGRPRRLLAEQIDPRHPNWSPDGLNLVFSASFIKGSSSNSFIGVLDSASNQVTVLPGSEGLASPQWSPDGHFIGVLSGENPEIYNVETKQWTALPVGPVNAITWSNNAHFVYFLRTLSDPGVFRASIQTGKVEKVVDLRGYRITGRSIDWFGLDPDDTPLVLHDVGTEDIYALTLDRK